METIEKIETTVDELELFIFNEKDELVPITNEVKLTLKQLQSAMQFFSEEVKRTVNEDLRSIWRRLDRIERRII